MAKEIKETRFRATLPDIKSAILSGGDGTKQVKLEVPEMYRDGVKPLEDWYQRELEIIVRLVD